MDSERLYKSAIAQLGYGAELMTLVYNGQPYEEDVEKVICQQAEVKNPGSVELLTDIVDFLAIVKSSNNESQDIIKNTQCPLYETCVAPQPLREVILGKDAITYFKSEIVNVDTIGAISIPIDATQDEQELKLDSTVIHIGAETSDKMYITSSLSLYERAAAVQKEQDLYYYTNRSSKYEVFGRCLVSRVISLSAYRKMLISQAVKHKKIRKYNPRQYLYLNLYVFGLGKLLINFYSVGTRAKEKGPFVLYRGPCLVEGEEKWGLYQSQERRDASVMTEERFSFVVNSLPLLHRHSGMGHYTDIELTTTVQELISPMHRCISVQICDCPVHRGQNCGVNFRHKVNPFIIIPPICYNMQTDLLTYVVIWLNTRFRKRGNNWIFIDIKNKEKEFEYMSRKCEEQGMILPHVILDYSDYLCFIT